MYVYVYTCASTPFLKMNNEYVLRKLVAKRQKYPYFVEMYIFPKIEFNTKQIK